MESVALSNTYDFHRGQLLRIADRSFLVMRVVPKRGLVLKRARWYHFLIYKLAHCRAKQRREHQ